MDIDRIGQRVNNIPIDPMQWTKIYFLAQLKNLKESSVFFAKK